MLPQEFTERMKEMLGAEYDEFLASYDLPKYQSLRVNMLKGTKEAFLEYVLMDPGYKIKK